jgi:hypothetical protein
MFQQVNDIVVAVIVKACTDHYRRWLFQNSHQRSVEHMLERQSEFMGCQHSSSLVTPETVRLAKEVDNQFRLRSIPTPPETLPSSR